MTYSFLTSESWRVDATAKTPKQAYKIAQQELAEKNGDSDMFGTLTGTYFKYDKDGFHAVDGIYYQI